MSDYNATFASVYQELNDLREDLAARLVELQNRVGDLESQIHRTAELAQTAEYMASDAQRAADDARNTAQRGW